MLFRSWGRRVLFALPLGAALLLACGSDDQPDNAGGAVDAAFDAVIGNDAEAGDATMGDGATDATTADAHSDAIVANDVTSDVVFGSDSEGGDIPLDSGSDAPQKDGGPDVVVVDAGCGPKTGYASTDAGACGTGQTYSCQGDQYVIDCECPGSQCTCTKNGTMVGPVLLYGGCSACTQPNYALLAGDCHVPY